MRSTRGLAPTPAADPRPPPGCLAPAQLSKVLRQCNSMRAALLRLDSEVALFNEYAPPGS